MSRTGHDDLCACWRCVALLLGRWLDELGARTATGFWTWFITITFGTAACPWIRGYRRLGSKPSPEFASSFFNFFIAYLEEASGGRVDFAAAHQLGSANGRLHLRELVSAERLSAETSRDVEAWLAKRAGFSRVLPYERGAAYYLARYVGRRTRDCEWDVRVVDQEMKQVHAPAKWGEVIVAPYRRLYRWQASAALFGYAYG
jgi:hypothetical protein